MTEKIECRPSIVVLIVDDEALIRMDVADYIEGPNIAAIEAENADAALKIISERDDIDVVFTDVNMPGSMDGLALARRVRETNSTMGIIIASGMARVTKAMLPSQAVFIEKPYNLDRVADLVRSLAPAH